MDAIHGRAVTADCAAFHDGVVTLDLDAIHSKVPNCHVLDGMSAVVTIRKLLNHHNPHPRGIVHLTVMHLHTMGRYSSDCECF